MDKDIAFLPTPDLTNKGTKETILDFNLDSSDIQSIYPIAELYMGDRRKEIPSRERLFSGDTTNASVLKRMKLKKKRKQKKKR